VPVATQSKRVDLLASEDALARRIAYEREERAWSPAGLADQMTKAGCGMNQSAIWKIENGEPRRKITVDELVGFAKVFDTPVEELLVAPEHIPHRRARQLCHRWLEDFREFENALTTCERTRKRLAGYLAAHPAAAEALGAQVGDYFKGGVAEADEIVEQVTAQAELVAELLEGD
jgi:transcriptional regulator with XRE-family HTH domain